MIAPRECWEYGEFTYSVKEDTMLGYETAEYHKIHSFCRKEGLDTDYFLYAVNTEVKKKRWGLIQVILSVLR